ncbi:MAG: DUF6295 family protein [Nitriliruptoraceae bacterium]
MCTTIADRHEFQGSAKGPDGWFTADHLYVGYDHPVHFDAEHAVSFDIVAEADGTAHRVAVELDPEAARTLGERLLAIADAADDYERTTSLHASASTNPAAR